MKKVLTAIFMLSGLVCLSQRKADSTIVSEPRFVLVLSQSEVNQLFSVLRTSGRYTGAELEVFIQTIANRLTTVGPPKEHGTGLLMGPKEDSAYESLRRQVMLKPMVPKKSKK